MTDLERLESTTYPTITQLLDRRDREARWTRNLYALESNLSAIAVVAAGVFALLMIVKVATAGGCVMIHLPTTPDPRITAMAAQWGGDAEKKENAS